MEISEENVDEYQSVKQDYKKIEHTREICSKKQDDLVKKQIEQDRICWALKQKCDKLEKNNEAFKINMRSIQIEYEKMSVLYQEEARLRPEILNKVKTARDILVAMKEQLQNNENKRTTMLNDFNTIREMYHNSNEELKNMMHEIMRLKDQLQTIYNTEKEKNEILTESLKRDQEMFTMSKKCADTLIEELKSELAISESKNKELTLQNSELCTTAADQKLELERKEIRIVNLQNDSTTLKCTIAETELRAQDLDRRLQLSDESIKFLTKDLETSGEKISNLEKQLCDLTKSKDCSDEFAKLREEKLHLVEKKLHDAEATIAKLLLENEKMDSELKVLTERIACLNSLEMTINEKENLIKDISDKYDILARENESLLVRLSESNNNIEELTKALHSERATVSAKMDIISELMADSKQNTDALSRKEAQLKGIQDDHVTTKRMYEERESSLKEGYQKRIRELEEELQNIRQSAHELRQRDFLLSPINLEETPERENPEQVLQCINAGNHGINEQEVRRRFEMMRRGEAISHLPLSGLRADQRANDNSEMDLPAILKQNKNERPKQRKFFKTKTRQHDVCD